MMRRDFRTARKNVVAAVCDRRTAPACPAGTAFTERRYRLCAALLCLFALLRAPALGETDQEVAARQVALELAGAFSNDGFKLRDGHWAGTLAPNESRLIAVNLYAGNQYWFSAGATEKAKQLGVEVFDEAGAPLAVEKYNAGVKVAAGLSVAKSGEYFVRVRLDEGEPAGVCFVYSYK